MGKDLLPASVYNDANSGIYLIAVDGDNKNNTVRINPGESSKTKVRSIDAIGAYSINDNTPVNLQLSDAESSWWKIPDYCDVTVTNVNGVPTLKVDSSIPGFGPKPAISSEWVKLRSDASQNQVAVPMKNVAATSAPDNNINTVLHTKLLEHLNKHHSPEETRRILLAVSANISEYSTNTKMDIGRNA